MKIYYLFSLLCMLSGDMQAQQYQVTTTQRDAFSISLIKLLNCAAKGFTDCKGKLIRSTSLMGDDHELTIPFPGSAAAVVRIRDWDKNAYIEFRGYADKKSRIQGVYDVAAKIKKALGDQLYDRNDGIKKDDIGFYALSVKDRNGFFSMNMEVFSGSSSAPIYLLGPEREDDSQPKKDFVLLKIYSGIPTYQYYIRPIAAPDKKLDETIRLIINAAEKDFDTVLFNQASRSMFSRKKRDTVRINGFDVLMNRGGSNRSASLVLPANGNDLSFESRMKYFKRVLEAALGSAYVYQLFKPNVSPYALFFSGDYIQNKPRIYLEDAPVESVFPMTLIRIESSFTHATKRSASIDDLP